MTPDDPEFEAYIRGAFFGGFEDVALGAPQTLLPLERFAPPERRLRESNRTAPEGASHREPRPNPAPAVRPGTQRDEKVGAPPDLPGMVTVDLRARPASRHDNQTHNDRRGGLQPV